MTNPQQQIIDKCQQVIAKAQELYDIDLSKVGIRFDLSGSAAGMAYRRGGIYYVRFNKDMMGRESFDHILNSTVSHEFAHILCFMNPKLGHGHDNGWRNVCMSLGGSGETRHKEEVIYARGITYEYISTAGYPSRVSQHAHDKIQSGITYTWNKGRGKVTNLCQFKIVGAHGKSFEQDVIANPNRAITVEKVKLPTVSTGSKESVAHAIISDGVVNGTSYEVMIQAIMEANGATRERARSLFSFCCKKFNIVFPN